MQICKFLCMYISYFINSISTRFFIRNHFIRNLVLDPPKFKNLQKLKWQCPFPEAVVRRCPVKKVFLEISQENTCTRDSFLITLLEKSLWHKCFPVNFAKFLRTPIFTEHLRWLLLHFQISNFCQTSFFHELPFHKRAQISQKIIFKSMTSVEMIILED